MRLSCLLWFHAKQWWNETSLVPVHNMLSIRPVVSHRRLYKNWPCSLKLCIINLYRAIRQNTWFYHDEAKIKKMCQGSFELSVKNESEVFRTINSEKRALWVSNPRLWKMSLESFDLICYMYLLVCAIEMIFQELHWLDVSGFMPLSHMRRHSLTCSRG